MTRCLFTFGVLYPGNKWVRCYTAKKSNAYWHVAHVVCFTARHVIWMMLSKLWTPRKSLTQPDHTCTRHDNGMANASTIVLEGCIVSMGKQLDVSVSHDMDMIMDAQTTALMIDCQQATGYEENKGEVYSWIR